MLQRCYRPFPTSLGLQRSLGLPRAIPSTGSRKKQPGHETREASGTHTPAVSCIHLRGWSGVTSPTSHPEQIPNVAAIATRAGFGPV